MKIFKRIYRSIYYSIRNIMLYRVERTPTEGINYLRRQIILISRENDGKRLFRFITDYMLTGVGLTVTDTPGNHLAWVYLTKCQRAYLAKARDVGGYNVDLL